MENRKQSIVMQYKNKEKIQCKKLDYLILTNIQIQVIKNNKLKMKKTIQYKMKLIL